MTQPAAIELVQLTKRFGDLTAVNNVTLRVEPGTTFGFIGPNGAGKSTTIRVLLDAIRPTSGSARVLEMDCHHDMVQVHRCIGYLPAELHLPDDLNASRYLDFLGQMRGLSTNDLRDELVDRFGLDPTRRLRDLSTGNKRKVALVQAFMHRPDVVLLDEPTSGIDPLIQHEFHEFLGEYTGQGGTVFLSSHTLSEVERVADRVGIIRDGHLVKTETIAALKAQVLRSISIEFISPADMVEAAAALDALAGVDQVVTRPGVIEVRHRCPVDVVLRTALGVGAIESVRAGDSDLEDVFLQYYETRGGPT